MSSPCQIFSMQMTLNFWKHFCPFPKNPEDFTAALIDFPSSFIHNLYIIVVYQNFDAGISFGKTVCFIEVSASIFELSKSRLIIAKSDIDKKASELVLLSLVKCKKYFRDLFKEKSILVKILIKDRLAETLQEIDFNVLLSSEV